MSVAIMYEPGNPNSQMPGVHPVAIARPQVGIERLPARRMSNEPRESMNCKSCRKRKIKCNRLRPACEACKVFQCPCIYDAVPKKRGPKTDVLDALLKRVDGLEAKLREKNAEQISPTSHEAACDLVSGSAAAAIEGSASDSGEPAAKRIATDARTSPNSVSVAEISPNASGPKEPSPPPVSHEILFDTYFSRFHAKPYHILDESSVRQRMQLGQLPDFLVHAISAVASRYAPHPCGYRTAVSLSEEYAARARTEIDTDEPSIDGLQAALLLVIAYIGAGKGKKAYMLMTNAIGMATALEIHREMDQPKVTQMEREMRRRLFWTCYLLDRFMACGSKRPSLISDKTIMLRLPSWMPSPSSGYIDGEFFQPGSNLQHFQGSGKKSQGSTGMLIDIARILGVTNRYLAAGGVRGDSHFPWHSLSNLSKIRQDLDTWASGTSDVFSSLEMLFGQPDSTALVFSKLIYHLVHCLIYRPFLPIDLAELTGNGQHESWQIEATNMCFLHANAIAELVELGKQTSAIEWPAFVGYCICTAGTVHIHGAHYTSKQGGGGEMDVFSTSPHFLSRELQHLSELRYAWASVRHHRETLQGIYNAHAELVKTVSGNMRYTPSFHLEDFFERYSNIGGLGGPSFHFDAANLSLSDAIIDFTADTYPGHDFYAPRPGEDQDRPAMRRKNTATSLRSGTDGKSLESNSPTGGVPGANYPDRSLAAGPPRVVSQQPQPALLTTPNLFTPQQAHGHLQSPMAPPMSDAAAGKSAVGGNAFGLAPGGQSALENQGMHHMPPGGSFSAAFNFSAGAGQGHGSLDDGSEGFDPIFGTLSANAFGRQTAWHDDDGLNNSRLNNFASMQMKTAPSPGANGSNHGGSPGQGDEKDPFLSLLEQLAENEQRVNNGSSELDFFLAGAGNGA